MMTISQYHVCQILERPEPFKKFEHTTHWMMTVLGTVSNSYKKETGKTKDTRWEEGS